MYRYIITTIFFILSMILRMDSYERRRARYYYGSHRRDFTSDYAYEENMTRNIREAIRHFFALIKVRKYLKRYNRIYTLKNANVIFMYDTYKMTFTCIEKAGAKRSAMIVWAEQNRTLYDLDENSFQRNFDNICYSFNEAISYNSIIEFLTKSFQIHKEVKVQEEINEPASQTVYQGGYINAKDNKEYKQPEKQININDADVSELSDLPGINIVTAKKIVKYREKNNGFKTKEEFYKEMKIKPHFQAQLENAITVGEFKKVIIQSSNNERIIDL